MSLEIEFFIPGKPAGEPRGRAFVRGRHAAIYKKDTSASGQWRGQVIEFAERHCPPEPLEGPVGVDIVFWMPRTKGVPSCLKGMVTPKLWRAGGIYPHASKPDRDNLDKLVLDTLTQIGFWKDDSIVCEGQISKLYVGAHTRPGAYVRIRQVPVIDANIGRRRGFRCED